MYEIHFDINPPKLTCKKYFTLDPDVTVNFIIIIIVNISIFLHFIIKCFGTFIMHQEKFSIKEDVRNLILR